MDNRSPLGGNGSVGSMGVAVDHTCLARAGAAKQQSKAEPTPPVVRQAHRARPPSREHACVHRLRAGSKCSCRQSGPKWPTHEADDDDPT